MKKTTKRIVCSVLSLMMASSLAVEYSLRTNAESLKNATVSGKNVTFENVTGQFNTDALRESNFNSSVFKSEEKAPVYETRTVIVTLDGKTTAEEAKDLSVPSFVKSWAGQRVQEQIESEQDAFLRKLKKAGVSYKLERRYDTVLNGVAIEVNTKFVSQIKQMDGVDSVVIATSYAEPEAITTSGTTVVENKTSVYETGIYDAGEYASYGEGTVVAVLDTGLDYTHPAFQNFKSDNVNFAWDEAYVASVLEKHTLTAETKSGTLNSSEVYVSDKVPYAYDYADDDPDVYPSYSNHGTHVAGIIGGYDPSGYADKHGNPITDKEFLGVVPDAQLAIFKVFTDDLDDPELGGAEAENIIAALEDCVTLGVDVINMSLGTSCGFTTTDDGDDEGELLNAVYNSIKEAGITLVCAASNDYSSGYGGAFGTNLKTNPDSSTVGSPSTFASALSVASINGQKASYMVANESDEENKAFVFFEEARDIDSEPFDFIKEMLGDNESGEFEYVVVPGVGQRADYTSTIKRLFKEKGRIALVQRGDTTFEEKVEVAKDMGAIGIIVYNNVAGIIRMNLGEIEEPIPSVSINMNTGNAMVAGAKNRVGVIKLDKTYAAGPFMSEFSSWGPTHDLKLKPEITAHGGEITSAVPGGYGEQSGTSMATPNMAGFMAIVRNYLRQELGMEDAVEINRMAMQLTMSTASTVYDPDGLPYSPRKQGAGVAKVENVVGGTKAYLYTDVAENDYRPKIELGDDPDKNGVYTLTYKIKNFGTEELSFRFNHEFMTETLAADGLAVSEQAYMLDDNAAVWSVDGKEVDGTISVPAGESKEIKVKISLSNKEKSYIEKSFPNGMYVEGFLKMESLTEGQCDLNIPFLGFYGDWKQAPMLDYSAFEVAASEQDASIEDEDKIKESVWATLPYASYYNEKYILPMGGYVYLYDEDTEDKIYVDEDHCAISRYNEYYGEDSTENYMTSTGIKALYAGLLRNARLVTYKMYNEETGELVHEETVKRVGKAYSGGGSAVPANVEMNFGAEANNLVANGKYRVDYEFFMEEEDALKPAPEENTFSFSFTVDYEAPVLEKASIRYYNYKDGNKEKQRIYLDVDVFDNHYAQAIMLCYPKVNAEGETVLQLATDYPTPVRNGNRNGTTTVSIEITDIYDKLCNEFGNQIYLQIDDYAINSCLYRVQMHNAHAELLPEGEDFSIAQGEDNLTLGIYETHKVGLVYSEEYLKEGKGDASNFLWVSANPKVADVVNGEIVGLSAGQTEVYISNRKGDLKTVKVTVDGDKQGKLVSVPSISFGVIKNAYEALANASGVVEVFAGQDIELTIEKDPWYHPMTGLTIKWESSDESVATVDQAGNVKTLKKGSAFITATIYRTLENGGEEETLYSASVGLRVLNEFTVSSYRLTDYNGVGYNEIIDGKKYLRFPDDMSIMYIAEKAFEDNNNIERIIIPETIIDIEAWAFKNCTALKEVYFVSENKQDIATADLKLIYEQAFIGCTNLEKVDFSNVKTVTIAAECFVDCTKLSTIVDMPSIGTMHHRAFKGCTALTELDLTGLHMSGDNVFEGCTGITSIETGKFTSIGNYMFKDCTGLTDVITLRTPKIGDGAFANCVNLSGVRFASDGDISFDIGANAFEYCGDKVGRFVVDFNGENVRTLGNRAFANSALFGSVELKGLKYLGAEVFKGTGVTSVVLDGTVDLEALQLSGVPFEGIEVTTSGGYTQNGGAIYSRDGKKLLFVNASVSGEFVVPSSVEEIASYAFAGSNVSKVTLSENVVSIGASAFENAKLLTIDFNGAAVTEIPARAFFGSRLTAIALPESVVKVGDSAFAQSMIHTFTGAGLKELGNNVFESCQALETIELADGIKKMGGYVFASCNALKVVTMPSVEELGDFTFYRARKLIKVTFGENATVTGKYTFAETAVTEVTFGNNVSVIDEGVFYNNRVIAKVVLPNSVTEIKAWAFSEASKLTEVIGLDKVAVFGDYAFYNSSLASLKLSAAKEIGDGAFATDTDKDGACVAKYTTLEIPAVEKIGDLAFLNGGESAIALPASLKQIGYGAFAGSDNLKEITVAADNKQFFAENNVLYRYINKDAGEYELVCYPAALEAPATDVSGFIYYDELQQLDETAKKDFKIEPVMKKTYSIKEGTLLVKAYAFYGLKEGAVEMAVLPYSVNSIGDSAFYASGITEYKFESIQAPVLEAVYRQEIVDTIEEMATAMTAAYYRGYFYANFETYLLNYTESYGSEESKLTMYYPANGVGYNNHIYSNYFKDAKSLGVLMEDSTRECIVRIQNLYEASEVKGWSKWAKTEENKAKVLDFAQVVKEARMLYDNVAKDESQFGFVEEELSKKLTSVESQLRKVKKAFGIQNQIIELKVAANSSHREIYSVGEKFSKKGLVLTIVYDDYSTESVKAKNVTLLDKQALTELDRYVRVTYKDLELRVTVVVDNELAAEQKNKSTGCSPIVGLVALFVVILLVAGAAVYLLLKKKATGKTYVETLKDTVKQVLETLKNFFKKVVEKVKELLVKIKSKGKKEQTPDETKEEESKEESSDESENDKN